MATAKKEKKYIVTVKNNPEFCGKGAGGVQFANGKAENVTERMAAWFKEHPGYDVKEIEVDTGAAEGAESLDKMKVDELKEYANAHGIDLGDAKTKAEILEAIKAAEGAE